MNKSKLFVSAGEILSFKLPLKKNMKFVDCSWHMPSTKRNGYTEFLQRTSGKRGIGGGIYFDLDECSDKNSPYPHMLLSTTSKRVFEEYMDNLRIGNDDEIILYDCDSSVHSRFRVYFTLKYFNHSRIRVLKESKVSTELEEYMLYLNSSNSTTATTKTESGKEGYKVELPVGGDDLVFKYEQLPLNNTTTNKQKKKEILIDARSRGRFTGKDKEPREGLKSGNIPNSINVPYTELFNDCNGEMKNEQELQQIFQPLIKDGDSTIICSCGSGVTAACLFFALHEVLGYEYVKLYDGSWTEYALRKGLIE